jgi:hypothetical protein
MVISKLVKVEEIEKIMNHIGSNYILRIRSFMAALFLLFFCAGLLSSCRFNSSAKENILIVAVDQLSAEQIRCSQDFSQSQSQQSGFEVLCRESVRYTHAFTTSPMSGPAIASVITGLYPFEHKLRHNGNQSISSTLNTLGKAAHQKGYATSFFSGGAPILRKMNLHTGFEVFDDHIQLSPTSLYRHFDKTIQLFTNWQKENSNRPFVSIIYNPDLGIIDTNKNTQIETELEQWDAQLGAWINNLKQQKIWDQTNFILIALNGHDDQSREDELLPLNIYAEHTQIPMFIKPARKPADEGQHWTFDANVTLADLGKTLIEKIEQSSSENDNSNSDMPVLSLSASLSGPVDAKVLKQFDRPILIESSWGQWQENTPIRFASRWNQYLFVFDKKIKIYNSFIDRFESTPIRAEETNINSMLKKISKTISSDLFDGKNIPLFDLPPEQRKKWTLLSDYFLNIKLNQSVSRLSMDMINTKDSISVDLYTLSLLEAKKWQELLRWSKKIHDLDLEKISSLNLQQPIENTNYNNPCLQTIDKNIHQGDIYKQCNDQLLLSFHENYKSDKESLRKKFFRSYLDKTIDVQISEINYAMMGQWDTSSDSKRLVSSFDLLMAKPEMQKIKMTIQRSLGLSDFRKISY